MSEKRIIVGVSGASGAVYGWRLLEKLRAQAGVETHLILTRSGERTAFLEMGKNAADFRALADHYYPVEDIGSRLASGSSAMDAMVIAPCSIHSMSAIAAGILKLVDPSRRRHIEGAQATHPDGQRNAVSFGPPTFDDRAGGNGSDHRAPGSRVLSQPDIGRRHRGA